MAMDPNLAMFAQMAASGQGGQLGPGAAKLLASLRQNTQPAGNPQVNYPGGNPLALAIAPPPAPAPPANNQGGGSPGGPGGLLAQGAGAPPMPPGTGPGPLPPGMQGPPMQGPQAGQNALPPPGMPPSPLEAMGIGARATPQIPPGMLPPGAEPPISAERATQMLALARRGGMPQVQGQPPQGLQDMAAAGRKGDTEIAHVSRGDLIIPPQIQANHPELAELMNRIFMQEGVNPTSRLVGHPDANINPATGQEEFGFLSSILPIALAVGATLIGAPYLAPELAALGMGAETAGAVATGLTSAGGSFAGNLLTGKPVGQAALGALMSGVGSAAGGALLGGANYAALGSGAVPGIFGTGATPVMGPAISSATGDITGALGSSYASLGGEGAAAYGSAPAFSPTDAALAGTNATGPTAWGAEPDKLTKLSSAAAKAAGETPSAYTSLGGLKGLLGMGMGAGIGSMLIPPKDTMAKPDLGPPLGPVVPYQNYISKTASYPTRFPTEEELRRYGRGGAVSFFG